MRTWGRAARVLAPVLLALSLGVQASPAAAQSETAVSQEPKIPTAALIPDAPVPYGLLRWQENVHLTKDSTELGDFWHPVKDVRLGARAIA